MTSIVRACLWRALAFVEFPRGAQRKHPTYRAHLAVALSEERLRWRRRHPPV